MNPFHPVRCTLALLAAMLSTHLYAASWRSVQDQSQLEFIASYEGAEAPGRFNRFDVLVSIDPSSLAVRSLLVDVDISSASMGNDDIDEAIAQTEWFNVQAYPHARFRSEQVRAVNDSEYVAEGVVSIKGVSKPISVPFRWRSHDQEAKLTGSLVLSRVDFGIGSGEWEADTPIGHEVQVRFGIALKTGQ
jgi:polyisoprenoid-binding protein YceI